MHANDAVYCRMYVCDSVSCNIYASDIVIYKMFAYDSVLCNIHVCDVGICITHVNMLYVTCIQMVLIMAPQTATYVFAF